MYPYPVYAALRASATVHRSRLLNAWLITRHADADAILRDHRNFTSDPRLGTLTRRQRAMLPAEDKLPMLILDPPDHTRLRAFVSKAFTSRAIDALESRIRATAAALLDAIDDPGGFDLVAAVAQPLPIIVIAEMLGVPAEDQDVRLSEDPAGRRVARLPELVLQSFRSCATQHRAKG